MRWPRLAVPPRVAMFVVGAGAFYHEVWLTGLTAPERPWILAVSGALMGLPFFFTSPGGPSSPSGPGPSGGGGPRPPSGRWDENRWDEDRWDEDREYRRRRIVDRARRRVDRDGRPEGQER